MIYHLRTLIYQKDRELTVGHLTPISVSGNPLVDKDLQVNCEAQGLIENCWRLSLSRLHKNRVSIPVMRRGSCDLHPLLIDSRREWRERGQRRSHMWLFSMWRPSWVHLDLLAREFSDNTSLRELLRFGGTSFQCQPSKRRERIEIECRLRINRPERLGQPLKCHLTTYHWSF